MSQQSANPKQPDADLVASIERTALELAQLAGTQIVTALGGMLSVRYKVMGEGTPESLKDPVSEVDHQVEVLIRSRLAERFPSHDIIGEEIDTRPDSESDFVWAIDPIDGTTNFVNGYPLFACTIGVLHRGEPLAAAIWCTTSHAIRPGVYHARRGGGLHFDEQPVIVKPNPAVRRRLAGVPRAADLEGSFDTRKSGSAAIECALVACGALQVARFDLVNLWDIAGGVMLVQAAGGIAKVLEEGAWRTLERFEPAKEGADLRAWKRPMVLGLPGAVDEVCALQAPVS